MTINTSERVQYAAYVGLSLGIFALTALAYLAYPSLFQRFLSRANPLLAVALVGILGALFFLLAVRRDWFLVITSAGSGRLLVVLAAATLMALVMIALDLGARFPRDMNVPFPGSVLFYPVTAYIVEILLHVLPLTALLLILSGLLKGVPLNTLAWASIIVVALIEPVLQISYGWPPLVVLHIFAFNFIELAMFKRYDFLTMYAFRLVYYILWHILWGHFRLGLLF